MEEAVEQYVDKKYRLKTSDNFDDYLKFIGVGLVSRKLACAATPVVVLTRKDDVYTFTMSTTFRTIAFSFKFNEEFTEERPDGCKLKALMFIEGGNMVHTQVESNGRKSTHVRTFTPDFLTVVSTADGWDGRCIRVYEAIQ